MSGDLIGTSTPAATCEWCGGERATTVEIRRGVVVGVCSRHRDMIRRNRDVADLKRRRQTLERRLPGRVGTDKEIDQTELAQIAKRLEELGDG